MTTALEYFTRKLEFETDCADVHAGLAAGADFVLLDARSPAAYASGHLPHARSLPHSTIDAESTAAFDRQVQLVTYCWGPHCNGATRAAARLAALGFSVKEMIGGVTGWQTEGYDLVVEAAGTAQTA